MLRWRMLSTGLVVTALAATMAVVPALGGTTNDSVGVVDQTQGLWYLRDPVTGATTSFYFVRDIGVSCSNVVVHPLRDVVTEEHPHPVVTEDGIEYLFVGVHLGDDCVQEDRVTPPP
jgi:hypothetical protein